MAKETEGTLCQRPALTETPAGTATLTFVDPANGTLQFNVDGVSATKAISRLVF